MNLATTLSEKCADFYMIAETAFHHEGDGYFLIQLIDAAASAGADGIKFQILIDCSDAYDERLPAYEVIQRCVLAPAVWYNALQYARGKGLEVIVMPIDHGAVQFIRNNKQLLSGIDIHSISLNEHHLLEAVCELGLPVILGIGGRPLSDIKHAIASVAHGKIVLMHGFQSFPTRLEDASLGKIASLRGLFKFPVGYADHTSFEETGNNHMLEYAYLLGARIFECHISPVKGTKRIDCEAAVSPLDFQAYRKRLDCIVRIMGSSSYTLNEAEKLYGSRQKQLVYSKDLQRGECLSQSSLYYRVTPDSSDYHQNEAGLIIGKRLQKDVNMYQSVRRGDLE